MEEPHVIPFQAYTLFHVNSYFHSSNIFHMVILFLVPAPLDLFHFLLPSCTKWEVNKLFERACWAVVYLLRWWRQELPQHHRRSSSWKWQCGQWVTLGWAVMVLASWAVRESCAPSPTWLPPALCTQSEACASMPCVLWPPPRKASTSSANMVSLLVCQQGCQLPQGPAIAGGCYLIFIDVWKRNQFTLNFFSSKFVVHELRTYSLWYVMS